MMKDKYSRMIKEVIMNNRQKRRHSIRTYVMVWSVGFAAILALAVAAASYIISQRYLKQNQRQSAAINIQLLGSEIGAGLDNVVMFTNWICIDTTISDYLRKVLQAENNKEQLKLLRAESVRCWDHLNTELSTLSIRGLIRRIIVSVPDGREYLQNIPVYDSVNIPSPAQKIMEQDYFEPMLTSGGSACAGLVDSPVSPYYAKKVLPVIRPVYSSTSTQLVGWVYIEVSQDLISGFFDQYSLAEDEKLYISIEGAGTYSYEDSQFHLDDLPPGAVSFNLPEHGWTVSVLPSRAELHSRSRGYLIIISIVFALILMAGFLITLALRRMIARPVSLLLDKLERVGQGDFSRDPDIEWDNELGEIGTGINSLSMNVSALMEKKVQDEKDRQDLEYRVLQSQINPHFMYNTLNTIKWMATIQGAEGIADMSTSLSRLLKNIAKKTENLISVKEEFDLLDDYFTIMKYRYAGTITLEYDIQDNDLLSQMITKFSLQPIVENAIFHGIEPKNGAGIIRVSLYREQDTFVISVTDNGVGMDENEIREVLSGTAEPSNDFFKQLGIANVNQRIKYAFGDSFGIRIESVKGEFTTMLLSFPFRENLPSTS